MTLTTDLSAVDWGRLGLDGKEQVALVSGQCTAEPADSVSGLLRYLLAERDRGRGPRSLQLYRGMSLNSAEMIPDDPALRVISTGMLGSNRGLWQRGQLDIVPEAVSRLPQLLREGVIGNDVTVIRVARDPAGGYSTGVMNDYLPAALESAGKLVLEVCEEMPILPGALHIEAAQADLVVEGGGPMPELPPVVANPTDLAIGAQVASVIEDGDCIQIGVGSLGQAVARALAAERRELGLHTGLLNDDLLDLIDSGAVTNQHKPIDRGISIVPVIMGSAAFYRRLVGRRDIELRSVEYTNDSGKIAEIHNLAAINSVVQVDLLGQLNAEVAAGRRLSSVGGQLDFSAGAVRSRGGKVIAMTRSTAKGGVSTIVSRLPDATVSAPGSLVDYVVTEYGVAHLRGATLEQRARRLIEVAHPDHRDQLTAELAGDRRIVALEAADLQSNTLEGGSR